MSDLKQLLEQRARREVHAGPDVVYQRALAATLGMDVASSSKRRRHPARAALVAAAVVTVAAITVSIIAQSDSARRVIAPTTPAESSSGVASDPPEPPVSIDIQPAAASLAAEVGVDLPRLIQESLDKMTPLVSHKGLAVTVQVDPSSPSIIPELGIGGYGDSSGALIVVDPGRMSGESLRVWVPNALAHAMYQSVRQVDGPGFGATLGEAIVSQGLATAFARETFPAGVDPPWAHALTAEQQHVLWTEASRSAWLLFTSDVANQWFWGAGYVPRWAGYTLGFEAVMSYLARHPRESAAALVDVPAARIIDQSGYSP